MHIVYNVVIVRFAYPTIMVRHKEMGTVTSCMSLKLNEELPSVVPSSSLSSPSVSTPEFSLKSRISICETYNDGENDTYGEHCVIWATGRPGRSGGERRDFRWGGGWMGGGHRDRNPSTYIHTDQPVPFLPPPPAFVYIQERMHCLWGEGGLIFWC